MLSIILKDVLIQKKRLLFIIGYVLFCTFIFNSDNQQQFILPVIGMGALIFITTGCYYDDKNKFDVIFNSIPMQKYKIVLSKYISAFAFGLVCFSLYLLVTVFSPIHKILQPGHQLIATFFLILSIIISLYLPIYYKLGYIKSRMANTIMFMIVFFGTSNMLKLGTWSGFNGIMEFIKERSELETSMLVLSISLLILTISYTLSLMFYKKREF